MLDFYSVAQSGDGSLSLDSQNAVVTDGSGNTLVTALQLSRNDAFSWVHVQVPLSSVVGSTVRIKFSADASPLGGHQSDFYVDNVSIVNATYTPTNSPTPSITRSFTRSPSFTVSPTFTRTVTPSPTPTYVPPSQVQNGDFSSGTSSWSQTGSDTNIQGAGPRGYTWMADDYSFVSVPVAALAQTVHVAALGSPQLVFWFQPVYFYDQNGTAVGVPVTGDAQFFLIRDPNTHATLATPLATAEGFGSWRQITFDLSPYIGQNIELYCGTSNTTNGSANEDQSQGNFGGIYILYGTPTPTSTASPSATATPSFTATRTATPSPTLTASASVTPSSTPTDSPTATPSWTDSPRTGTPMTRPRPPPSDTPTRTASVTDTPTDTAPRTVPAPPSPGPPHAPRQ